MKHYMVLLNLRDLDDLSLKYENIVLKYIGMSVAKAVVNLMFNMAGLVLEDMFRKKRYNLTREFMNKITPGRITEIKLPEPPSITLKNSNTSTTEEPCAVCSVKHLLSSKTFLIEGRARKDSGEKQRKVMEAYRELQAAEQHLVEEHPDLAAEVRGLRKEIEVCAFTGEYCDEIDISKIDVMIRKVIPHIPREHYFKPIETVEA